MNTRPQPNEAYYKLLHELQAIDFVLVELSLFLGTHPGDAQALQQFNAFHLKRTELAQQYEAAYGPLLQFGHSPNRGAVWQWGQAPWPWQV
ncbi:spore coat protein CotJB [Paenibacillus koleovorans]|uniref:spore coat protein CotJB n=1 Tax=Paenibacillus koleovorans TaxID=121608 RepID=UPI000FDC250C|nr:spore coat protein CotJB [Paenibacillus koleovorans]